MSDYPEGIPGYIVGRCEVVNYFPINKRGDVDLCCDQCKFYVMRNRRCYLTNELLNYPERDRGRECPLELESYST